MTYSNSRKSYHDEKQPVCDEEGLEKYLTQSDENYVLAFDILYICSLYRSKHNLHIILNFGSLHSIYSPSVQYLSSKHDSR